MKKLRRQRSFRGLGSSSTVWLLGGAVALLALVGGKVVLDMKNAAEWAQFVFGEVTALFPNLPLRSRVIIVAHAAFESGWGQKAWAALNGNNIFNITTCKGKPGCNDGWTGAYLDQADADWEYKPDGSRIRIPQRWRAYANLRESIADYWVFINRARYAAAIGSLQTGDLVSFLGNLRAGGYFTLDLQTYVDKMSAVLDTAAGYLNVEV